MLKRVGIVLVLAAAVILGLSGENVGVRAGGGCHQIASGFTDARSVRVSISECRFEPAVVRIEGGETIGWTNNDNLPHTVTGVADSWGDFTKYAEGETVSYTFAEAGVYPYFCELHPGMVGAVVVGNGASSSTEPAGSGLALLAAVPAGDAQPAVAAAVGGDSSGFPVTTTAVIGVALAAIISATALSGLRLAGKLAKGRE